MAMLTGIILAVLGVLIVVAYLKREQPWAKPVLWNGRAPDGAGPRTAPRQ